MRGLTKRGRKRSRIKECINGKLSRFLLSFKEIEAGRQGKCTPERCSTLDGKKGAACCHLGYRCPLLSEKGICKRYVLRLPNCRTFPARREHLELVKNCGYFWPGDLGKTNKS